MIAQRVLAAMLLVATTSVANAEDFTLPTLCEVDLVDDIELHATESGILDYVAVREGSQVRSEDILVKIDTSEPEKMKEIAKYKLDAALQRAREDIEVRYAQAQADAAEATVLELEETNRMVARSVTEADLREARLQHKRAVLGIEKAENDRKLAELDAWGLKAEYEAADMAIERRTIRAPFDGLVIKKYRSEKEWAQPGEPILQLVRLDQLQVEGLVSVMEHSPAELNGCEVTINVQVANGRVVPATGRVVYIHPVLLRGQKAVVRAEITNRQENGAWLILPKMTAKMTIHLGTGGVAVGAR